MSQPVGIRQRLARFVDWFLRPELRRDSDMLRRGRLFVVVHLTAPFVAFAVAGTLFAVADIASVPLLLLTIGFGLVLAFPLLLKHVFTLPVAGLLSVLLYAILVFFSAYYFGGLTSFLLPWMISVPIVGLFFIGRRGGAVSIAFAAAGLLALLALHLAGHEFPQPVPEEWLGTANLLSTLFCALYAAGVAIAYVSIYEQTQESLSREISKHKRTARKLREAKNEAEKGNMAKSQFLAAISHELRTPLNAIIGFSEIMKVEMYGPIGEPKYREYANDIHVSGQHLLELINDVLDISKVEAGKMRLNEAEVDVHQVIRSCLTLTRERAEEALLVLESRIREPLPRLYADQLKLKQILLNLLSNAVKFTPPGGTVTLEAAFEEDRGLVLKVVDTGIGIPPEEIPKALEAFGQVQGDLNRRYEGTGLGLALTKALVELHGGSLHLESEVDAGTTATALFPVERIIDGNGSMSDVAE